MFMHEGRVWEKGPGEMLEHPATPELQQFVGKTQL